ncbi:MAG: six-cysteine ranthipeptide SCIFF [Sphingopyxis sp.]|nr:six-cysteine ranthipeptide SCIFF [Sphingopyxis sp.]
MRSYIGFRWFSRAVSANQKQSSCHLRLTAETYRVISKLKQHRAGGCRECRGSCQSADASSP